MSLIKESFCALVFLSLVYESTSIRCYDCNSANNSACLDVKKYESGEHPYIVPIIDCEMSIPNSNQMQFFCRKIVQTIFHSHRDSEVRVTRSCGWRLHEKDCYKDDNSDHLGTVCQCFHDMCNSSEAVDPTGISVLFLCLSAILYFWR
ncbi:uncharacterized protein LOC123701370 [Colias croceus]|uniref:uncharacterized protein LOC123701370 n=1 Tax=Colias crocea TaxID=72248 RepID=UPI001E27CF71|nr:uncharacterized protein LOC123701370 [Colias croceus]XP_045504766.1 uncharacterized protein LOC123701370 [Colias croceus]